jgi:hypothetical protein
MAITFSDSEVTRAELVNTTWEKHSARGPVHGTVHVDQYTAQCTWTSTR